MIGCAVANVPSAPSVSLPPSLRPPPSIHPSFAHTSLPFRLPSFLLGPNLLLPLVSERKSGRLLLTRRMRRGALVVSPRMQEHAYTPAHLHICTCTPNSRQGLPHSLVTASRPPTSTGKAHCATGGFISSRSRTLVSSSQVSPRCFAWLIEGC